MKRDRLRIRGQVVDGCDGKVIAGYGENIIAVSILDLAMQLTQEQKKELWDLPDKISPPPMGIELLDLMYPVCNGNSKRAFEMIESKINELIMFTREVKK